MLTLHKMLVKACKIWEDWKHFYKLVPTFSGFDISIFLPRTTCRLCVGPLHPDQIRCFITG